MLGWIEERGTCCPLSTSINPFIFLSPASGLFTGFPCPLRMRSLTLLHHPAPSKELTGSCPTTEQTSTGLPQKQLGQFAPPPLSGPNFASSFPDLARSFLRAATPIRDGAAEFFRHPLLLTSSSLTCVGVDVLLAERRSGEIACSIVTSPNHTCCRFLLRVKVNMNPPCSYMMIA